MRRAPRLHTSHYTTSFRPEARYVVADWAMRRVFTGEPMAGAGFAADSRFAAASAFERRSR